MADVTEILSQIDTGDALAAEQLLPRVYDELRKLAASRVRREQPGQTLQATALVHEAFMRMVDVQRPQAWNSRGHFFAAAGQAMRRILVERARLKQRRKFGLEGSRLEISEVELMDDANAGQILAVHESVEQLAAEDPQLASLVNLRYFAGFSLTEAAEALGIGKSTAYEHWAYAKSRLKIILEEVGNKA